MELPAQAQRLTIYIGEGDKYEGKPLFEAIVLLAREKGLAGATVLKGVMGFGLHSRIHTAKVLRLSADLPIVVEIVDKPERIETFLPLLDAMIPEGLITLERVTVIAYRQKENR